VFCSISFYSRLILCNMHPKLNSIQILCFPDIWRKHAKNSLAISSESRIGGNYKTIDGLTRVKVGVGRFGPKLFIHPKTSSNNLATILGGPTVSICSIIWRPFWEGPIVSSCSSTDLIANRTKCLHLTQLPLNLLRQRLVKSPQVLLSLKIPAYYCRSKVHLDGLSFSLKGNNSQYSQLATSQCPNAAQNRLHMRS
jgi:hypothetical protein